MTAHDRVAVAAQAQRRASDPTISAWVSANAGSGKTHVLVQRIIRLLLAGVPPHRILALTYTKAAAANMANRVFGTLGGWVTLDDAALAAKLRDVDGTTPDAARLKIARRLFARAVETPGGLKIQTIHAFCERLLQLFPFEANVAARFEVLDDAARAMLEAGARRGLLNAAAAGHDPELATALDTVTKLCGETKIEELLREAMRLKPLLRRIGGNPDERDEAERLIAATLGLKPGETIETIDAELERFALTDGETEEAIRVLTGAGGKYNLERAEALAEARAGRGSPTWREIYDSAFLTEKGKAASDKLFFTGEARKAAVRVRAEQERDRVATLHERRRAAEAARRTRALLVVADFVLSRYESAKAARGALDFDDLIERTEALLSRSEAAWVLFKLDQGIDHLLVDEAQDTSPMQWAILRRLTDEFFPGEGARADRRTVFAVGDPKQSIYSFQGAEPAEFARSRAEFGRLARASAGEEAFAEVSLNLSFRSSAVVLGAVDSVFKSPAAYDGLDDAAEAPVHEAREHGLPGLVELRPVIEPEREVEEPDWLAPPDAVPSPAAKLAKEIADLVSGWLRPESEDRLIEIDPADRNIRSLRPIRAGDVMILVRSRNAFFEAVIRALKDAGIPVAGADRLQLTEHIAVMDLTALGRAVLLPEDDLSLAEALKSPLFGLDDDDLIRLAPRRPGSLHAALAASADDEDTFARFERLRGMAAGVGPFAFYAAVLGAEGGRAAMTARLGAEAGDAIDEFLKLALDHEHDGAPSLQRFLASLASADLTVKRDMEAGRDEVRVMTVHGAKGLEAPIVLLPDTCGAPDGRNAGAVRKLSAAPGSELPEIPVWSPSSALDCVMADEAKQAEVRRQLQEHRRLLYVALTRAKERLYIFGHVGSRRRKAGCWYDLIEAGLADLLEPVTDGSAPEGTLRRNAPAQGVPLLPAATEVFPDAGPEPDWLRMAAAEESPPAPPFSPSSALDAADRPTRALDGPFMRRARLVGTMAHTLLELLPDCPEERREAAATRLTAARGRGLTEADRSRIVTEVLRLVRLPDLAPIFGRSGRSEVTISGELQIGGTLRAVSGRIDRLAETDEAVFVVDYKTSAKAPASVSEIPRGHAAQLAIYRALLAPLYPAKPIRCVLIYTAGPVSFEIPADRLDAAWAEVRSASDAGHASLTLG
jgi:ATP-dependent helicase/nuclease subunit A